MKINLSKHYIDSRTKEGFQELNPKLVNYRYDDTILSDSDTVNFETTVEGRISKLGLKEISLGYINIEEVNKDPIVIIEENFLTSSKEPVRPYDTFLDEDTYLFDGKNNIQNRAFKRQGGIFYYEPAAQTEFSPLSFKARAVIKKEMIYNNKDIYDLQVAVIDSTSDQSFSATLLSIFGDKYIYGNVSPNIRINGGATTVQSLTGADWKTADFLFLHSWDGIHLGYSTVNDDLIDFDSILSNRVNIWISCDSLQDRFKTVTSIQSSSTLSIEQSIVFDETEHEIPKIHMLVFDKDYEIIESQYPQSHEYFNDATFVVHRRGQGFIIYTPAWFLEESITSTYKLVYETLINYYLQSYRLTPETSLWITDLPVDYLSYHTTKFNQCHNTVNISELVSDFNIGDEYKVQDVLVTTPYVSYEGTNPEGVLLFKKNGGVEDPVKEIGTYSFYTTKHTVIYYQQEDLYKVEQAVNLEFSAVGSSVYLIVHPYISSQNKAVTRSDQTFEITSFNKKYILYLGAGSSSIENTFFLLTDLDIPEEDYVKVATFVFRMKTNPSVSDSRIMGGGLPDDQPDDYDMLDIGHIFGRPYRVGATLIIRLPLKLSAYEERIKRELDKHIAAGDEYVLSFESVTEQ